MIPTPNTDHVTKDDKYLLNVYEPAEDTFILLDALEQDQETLKGAKLCLEVGSGSGCVSSFLSTIIGPSAALYLSTDINQLAAECTQETSKKNSTINPIQPIITDLVSALFDRVKGMVDVLIFNPPYVVTEDEEALDAQSGKAIEGAWAGGGWGMVITNRLLTQINQILSPSGVFYLVAIHRNQPEKLIDLWSSDLIRGQIVLKRRAGGELLYILKFSRVIPPK